MTYTQVLYTVNSGIATVSMNRPAARNGYTMTMADELSSALTEADQDPDVRVVVLTGEGTDFCVGADLSGGSTTDGVATDGSWQEPAGRCSRRIYESSKPVIAAIRGAAVGAGSTIVLPADYRLAATDSRFGFVFTQRGFFPEGGSAWYLPRLVGMGTASDWMISGRVFGAEEALAAGLVHRLFPADEVYPAAIALAEELIATTAPVSVAVTRQMLLRMSAMDSPHPAHDLDSRLIAGIFTSPDAAEGIMSFLERRPPRFPGTVPADLPEFLPW
ncbi:enoyl-CoA hydratase/isomerase family protein [Rhodococcus pseudokoreensis]|uniref:Enoyl-CoA hydratase/isomerase family protein n=1 Tax=Rhodococcus pseudokoreensis TaxID=2811421 RepID=A0A974W920_9NOCA|nr:enoyl-CoA hydratase-related protein [Rhodococcus pseudokoreensis]QSE92493.1 enoyl-CoA hydratase/isomerase family protein [Rhodococcus pseudokoreensis]